MKKESLLKAKSLITSVLKDEKDVDYDFLELIINVNKFLEPKEYEENIKILSKKK